MTCAKKNKSISNQQKNQQKNFVILYLKSSQVNEEGKPYVKLSTKTIKLLGALTLTDGSPKQIFKSRTNDA
jgi:hypothetical protein